MGSAKIQETIRFGEDFKFDLQTYRLSRDGRVLKLERIPTEILLFLIEQNGLLVTREQIAEKIWGKGVFLNTDNSINGAIRKVRQVLKDDPEQPRFIETITGKGYRFIGPVGETEGQGEPDTQPLPAGAETGTWTIKAGSPQRMVFDLRGRVSSSPAGGTGLLP